MNLIQPLKQFGLTEKEAAIYLACLQLGQSTAFQIAKKSGIKRATAYQVLETLNIKGLIHISKSKKASLYTAISPKKLLHQLEFRKKSLEEAMPLLISLNQEPGKPNIQVLEGKHGLEYVFDEALEIASRGNEILTYGSLAYLKNLDKNPYKKWILSLSTNNSPIREILKDCPFDREYSEEVKKQKNKNHKIRFSRTNSFENDNLIYGNKLAILSTEQKTFVTLIESRSIANSYRGLFDLAWEQLSS